MHEFADDLKASAPLDAADGPAFWRSLDEWAQTEAFRAWAASEFPSGLMDGPDGPSRREALALMAASLALAGWTGCSRPAGGPIVPRVRADDAAPVDHPLYYATAITRDGYANGVLVKSHAGRPTKIEGNPDHPASLGATDVFTQAAILDMYDPDRSQAVYHNGRISTWSAAERAIADRTALARGRNGRGLRLLTGPTTSPTLIGQIRQLLDDMPQARWHVHSAALGAGALQGANLAFDRPLEAMYRLDRAEVIVALDSDFLYDDPGAVRYARDYADARRVSSLPGKSTAGMNRLYVAEPCPTVTGTNADHRLPAPATRISDFACRLAIEAGAIAESDVPEAALSDVETVWLQNVAADLRAHRGRSVVVAGRSQPAYVHALVHLVNEYLANLGQTLAMIDPVSAATMPEAASLAALMDDVHSGSVETLLILDANPIYDAPVDLDIVEGVRAVPFVAHAGHYRDETARMCEWHVPLAHELESWADARAYDGSLAVIQPLIAPLYEGRPLLEVLELLGGRKAGSGNVAITEPGERTGGEKRTARAILRDHWRGLVGRVDFDAWWVATLQRGQAPDSAARPVSIKVKRDAVRQAVRQASPPDAGEVRAASAPPLELNIQLDPTVRDGRHSNNGWLQELPKPLTRLTWDNAALLSPATASALGVASEDVVRLEHRGRRLEAPAWILPGHADACVTVSLGYGRWAGGRVGTGRGFSAYTLRVDKAPWFCDGLAVQPTGRRMALACTQSHQLMENRDLVRAGTLRQYTSDPAGLVRSAHEDVSLSLYPARTGERPQWGMSIDLTTCIGCNACVVACQAENNIPVVGADQVRLGREMHWIRVDRYFEGLPAAPVMHHQPVPCMHCEDAPCEVVCPVSATTHSHDGLNEMTYNRCVGTRYCSNNCPYKVRRFNFHQYADVETPSLRLQYNPGVTVRERGVMEKCTYCVQRIRTAHIQARKDNRDIRDGDVLTACQQACPAKAIVFGDLLDPQGALAAAKREPHDYALLAHLNVRPRTTYLARVFNPNSRFARDAAEPGSTHHGPPSTRGEPAP